MKKIIDANFFRNPELEAYLGSDKRNMVVFNEYACMEAYKGDAIKNISKSIEIVSKFPDQVIILKGTRDVVNLIVSASDLYLLEHKEQTRGFKRFCSDVQRAVCGYKILATQILKKGEFASKQFEKIREDTIKIATAINLLEKSFKSCHLKYLRKGQKLPDKLSDKIVHDILMFAVILFKEYTNFLELPKYDQMRNTYIFRLAISNYLLGLRWISEGGPGKVSKEKLQNDIVDMGYVAYASFFDGLLTRDIKMKQIYQDVCLFLNEIYI